MSTFDLCSSCHKLIQPFAQLSNFPLDFPQLRLLSPTTQIIVAELLCDVCLELASQHADVRVTVDRPFAIFEPSSVDALDDEIRVDPVLSASCHVAQSRSLTVHSPYSAKSPPLISAPTWRVVGRSLRSLDGRRRRNIGS